MRVRRTVRAATTVVGTLALVAGMVMAVPVAASAADGAVISEIAYAGGDTTDFIEIKTAANADLSGWVVGTVSRGGTPQSSSNVVTLPSGTAANAAGYYAAYVPITNSVSSGSAADGNYGASAFVVGAGGALLDFEMIGGVVGGRGVTAGNSSSLPASVPGQQSTPTGATAPSGQSIQLIDGNWVAGVPSPGEANSAGGADQGSKTIAEIQGTGDTSPFNGDIVTTKGVVTATYPTGGFNGYTIQTPGTGGDLDFATHTASDGLFVYSPATVSSVTIGDYVQVTGTVSEFAGLTELTVAADGKTALDGAGVVAPKPISNAWPATDAQRESIESMLFAGSGTYTITNTYSTNQYGELGLAFGDKPLIQWTDQAKPGSAQADAIKADNAARAVTLDDGSSENFLTHGDDTPPYLSQTKPVRVGEQVTFTDPVIVDYRNSAWKLQPTAPVVGGTPVVPNPDAYPATWTDSRTATPDAASIAKKGAPDIKAASFNVLNFFTMTGEKYVAAGGTCSSFKDRDGNPITVNRCDGQGPRGAWDDANFARQYAKTVSAIRASGANLIGLMEIENSVVVGEDKDTTLKFLVDQLNAKDGAGTWAYVAPATDALPDPSQQDVINCAIIYQPAVVTPVGDTLVLADQSGAGQAFEKARTPIAQVFAPTGGGDPVLFVVNHFKSKGSAATSRPGDEDSGDGQGASNLTRVEEATALVAWLDTIKASTGVDAVVSVGDYNSYGQEDPMQVLYQAGYVDAERQFDLGKYSYSFSGLSGSLDHALLNKAALDRATGADIWNINSPESVALEYSRYNYAGTLYYQPDPFASSDHDPVVVGLKKAAPDAGRSVQILGINDFHGRISANGQEAGAAVLAGAVNQLRSENPNTVFSAAGDLIGASTFESFIAHDKPTIDALNAAGLQVSAVGNHEFDQGYQDLIDRVMAPYNKDTNPYGGAQWKYLGANVKIKATGNPALDATWVKTMDNGVKVGFVGAVTEHLDELVSPAGIADLEITDIADAVNTEADKLKADGDADIVIMLVHEGSPNTSCASVTDNSNDFGKIVNRLDANVDAVISGHTHLTYNCMVEVPAWKTAGRTVTERPVVSAGQYGYNLDQLLFTVSTSGDVTAVESNTIALTSKDASGAWHANYAPDGTVGTIVSQAVANADVLGAKPLGDIAGPFTRAKLADGVENRGGESTLGNLVAEAQRWATEGTTTGAAQIAFMNPGGLRADMVGNDADGYPAVLTYKQAATVQPFANTLVNMSLTGAQIKTVLEQQWQPAGSSRPFLRLGISKGFTYTYDPAAAKDHHITAMWLDGKPIDPSASYSVTVNSFLASGGDNFFELDKGANKKDTGQTDLQGMVDYMGENAPTGSALPVDYTQRSVGVTFPNGASVLAGGDVAFSLSSLSFSSPVDVKDTSVSIGLGSKDLGSFAVDSTVSDQGTDETGTADVSVTIPAGTPAGPTTLTVRGNNTGTTTTVTVQVEKGPFSDVDGANPFVADIAWLVDNGIAQGYPDGTFRPRATLTRQAMAGFLFRLLNPDTDAPACDPQDSRTFSDVPASNAFCGEIEALAAEGVVSGFGGGIYGPARPMTRQATTALLFRIANAGVDKPTCTGSERAFSDVPTTNAFCGEIEWAAEVGVVQGYLDGTFKPGAVLTRQAMAGLLHRFVAE